MAERRVDGAVDDREADQEDTGHEGIKRHRAAQVEQPEQHAAWHRLQAVFAAGPG